MLTPCTCKAGVSTVVYTYHVFPNYVGRQWLALSCTRRVRGLRMTLTFSSPKNLSLPSPRMGPALCNSFSTGVRSCGGSSFLFLADVLLSAFETP